MSVVKLVPLFGNDINQTIFGEESRLAFSIDILLLSNISDVIVLKRNVKYTRCAHARNIIRAVQIF